MSRMLRILHRSGWEFWLPLPLIAVLLWVLGNFMTTQVLNRPYGFITKLQADTPSEVNVSVSILAINAEIDRSRGVTTIFVTAADSTAKDLEYELPVVETAQVEAAIAKELGVTADTVRKLASYRIKD